VSGPQGPVTVVIAEDSTTARALLVSICDADPGITVVGQAADGMEAVRLTRQLRPSIVLMDVYMPVLDGLEATKQIMREQPTPILMVTAGTRPGDVEVGLSALRFGALSVLPKPQALGTPEFDRAARHLVAMVKALADVKVIRRRTRESPTTTRTPGGQRRLVAVAASTGGPPALCRFLQELPPALPVPVIVVQHIVEGFLPGLAGWLRNEVPFRVVEAAHGQRLEAGSVYLAPDGYHLRVEGDLYARLTRTEPVSGFRPSATVMFRSVAESVGAAGIGVVLTGMGDDGLDGMRALHAAGGLILAQDKETSVVHGMPRVVAEAGLADVVGPVGRLAAEVAAHVMRGAR
jgi:two-component system chemotaxis response regulator CheB